mgnify:CR=1 FL=1
MAGATGFADLHVFIIDVAHLADGGRAVHADVPHFAGGQADLSGFAFLGHQLSRAAGAAHQLGALAGIQLDVVDDGAQGMLAMGRQLPGLMSAVAEEYSTSPTFRPLGAMM